MRHRVVVLLSAPVVGYDVVIPPQIFGSAVDEAGAPLYDVTLTGFTPGPVATDSGYSIVPEGTLADLAAADTVVVPGTRMPGPRCEGVAGDELRDAFARVRPDARVMSICTGAFVLGALGRLDGRRATTHWQYADDFRALYPRVELDEDQLFVDEGDVLSSAGLSAGVDLCLHVIRRDFGAAVANRAARHCVVPPWRDGGQSQFIERPVPAVADDSTAGVRAWALTHLDQPLDVARLAGHARMSVRTFNRRFRDETGRAPGAWLAERRLDHARQLLETTDLGIDAVARRAGFGTGATLRLRMRDTVGLSPAAYRRTFRGVPSDV